MPRIDEGQEENDAVAPENAPEVAQEAPVDNAENQENEAEIQVPDIVPLNEYTEADRLALKDLV